MSATLARSDPSIRMFSIAALMVCSMSTVLAADWPVFKPGNWTFEQTMSSTGAAPDKASNTRCTDPTADHKAQQGMFANAGCQVMSLTQNGNTYRYSATCKLGGMTTKSDSVLTVESAEAYTITVDSNTDGSKTYDVLHAHRIVGCATISRSGRTDLHKEPL